MAHQLSISILNNRNAFETFGSFREVVEPEVRLIISLHPFHLKTSKRKPNSTCIFSRARLFACFLSGKSDGLPRKG
jgi:hypothetical protein